MELGEIGRYWQVACSYFCEPGKSTETQVVVYGGAKHDPSVEEVQFCNLRDLTILSFGMTVYSLQVWPDYTHPLIPYACMCSMGPYVISSGL